MVDPKRGEHEDGPRESSSGQVNHRDLKLPSEQKKTKEKRKRKKKIQSNRECRKAYISARVPLIPPYQWRTHKERQASQEETDRVRHKHSGALPNKHHLPSRSPYPNAIAVVASRVRQRPTPSNLSKDQWQKAPHILLLGVCPMMRLYGRFPQQLQHRHLLGRKQQAENGKDEARIPKGRGEPVGVLNGAPGEGTDGGGGENGALGTVCQLMTWIESQRRNGIGCGGHSGRLTPMEMNCNSASLWVRQRSRW